MVVPSPPQRLAGPFCNRHPAPAGRRLDLQVFGVFEQDFRRLDAYANSARCLRTSRPKPNAEPSRPEHTSLDSRRPHTPATDMPLAQPAPPEPAPVRPHDAAYKLLFSFPEMVRDLLAGFVSSEWVAELDLSTLERWPASQVGDTLRERHQDRVWRVRYRHRWLYVLVLLEFQSTVDRTMAVRVLTYTALLYQDLLRTSTEPLPPVLPIVLHHGPGRWTAAMDVAGLAAPSGAFLAPYQPAQRYFLLDVGDYTDAPLPHGRNLVAALVRLERSRSDADAEAVLGALDAWLSESGNEALRRAVGEWMRQVHAQRRRGGRGTAGCGESDGGAAHAEGEDAGVDGGKVGGRARRRPVGADAADGGPEIRWRDGGAPRRAAGAGARRRAAGRDRRVALRVRER